MTIIIIYCPTLLIGQKCYISPEMHKLEILYFSLTDLSSNYERLRRSEREA